ncbi:MAG TPA: hypothetical protein VGO18_13730, partial [Steroidobacteraceae bacterium]|nr:hypothetical protein [Steroidobacteraceae bacterium]
AIANKSGAFIVPSVAAVTAAAAGAAASLPPTTDYRVSIVNAPGADAYPISSFTWILIYQHQTDAAKKKKLVDFMTWAYDEGEKDAPTLDYAPLPAELLPRVKTQLAKIDIGAQR